MELLKGGAVMGIVIALWDKIKMVGWRIISLVIQRVEFCTEDMHDVIVSYLIENFERSLIYDKIYGAEFESFRNGTYGLVSYEKFGDNSILFKCKKKSLKLFRPFFLFSKNSVSFGTENTQHGSGNNETKVFSTIMCLRGTLNFDELIAKACSARNRLTVKQDEENEKFSELDRFNIFYLPDDNYHGNHHHHGNGLPWYKKPSYRVIEHSTEDLGRQYVGKGKALDQLYYPPEIKGLINTISLWVKSKNWYFEKNIPWKRGWLLYGKPGTGKTALVRAFAEDLNLPIYVYSLSQMSNKTLISEWRNMQSNTPCIALIEDFDNVFHGRKNISRNNTLVNGISLQTENSSHENIENKQDFTPLTFDCLLNCIDGVDKSNGVFTIITTNDITKIDSAIGVPLEGDHSGSFISSRPGRIDRVIELGNLTKENKLLMARKFLNDYPEELADLLIHIDNELEETPAQFQELCSQKAVEAYWKIITVDEEIHELFNPNKEEGFFGQEESISKEIDNQNSN